ncbi:hypothetical protein KX816_14580 [Sphingosinicellaceae bacterium]|nr:hypothetical protein KX816_14580 [Sphingosinicellaceae bacterium]
MSTRPDALSDRLHRWLMLPSLPIILLVIGAILRIGWLVVVDDLHPYTSESHHIAIALATKGQYADAFGAGTGPTAHLAPTTPLISAAAYRLFGVTHLATVVLSLQAIAVVSLSFLVAFRAFALLGAGMPARLAGLAIVTLLPLQFSLEVREFRGWEGGISALLIALMLLQVLKADSEWQAGGRAIGTRGLIGFGLGVGAIGIINPASGLAATGMVGILLIRRVRWTRWMIPVAAAAIVVTAVTLPWALYNQHNVRNLILTRSSLGLSLSFVYHDAQLTQSRQDAYNKRFYVISPQHNAQARADYIRLGDVEYNRRLENTARDWMANHPDTVNRIRRENIRDYYLPPAWFFSRFGGVPQGAGIRVALIWAGSIFGLLTLAVMLARRRWLYLYVLAAVTLPAVPYILVYPLLRYRYMVSTLLFLMACDGAWRLWTWWRARRTVPAAVVAAGA